MRSIGERSVRTGSAGTDSEELPATHAVGEFVPGFEASSWYGIGTPRNTPARNHRHAQQANQRRSRRSQNKKIRVRLVELGAMTLTGSPADFGKLIADETEKWGKVIRAANIKPE
jgi:tripartite-type tricarboxylate transporter receptor subunit TctC